MRELHLDAPAHFAVLVSERHHRAGHCDAVVAPHLRAVLLHLEQVGEVGLELERDRARSRLPAEVADDKVLPHAVAYVPASLYEQRAVGLAWVGLTPRDEGRGERMVRDRSEAL